MKLIVRIIVLFCIGIFFVLYTRKSSCQEDSQNQSTGWPLYGYDSFHTSNTNVKGPSNPKIIWKYKTEGNEESLYCSPVVSKSGNIIVGTPEGTLHVISKDGKKLWTKSLKEEIVNSLAINNKDIIYCGTANDKGCLYAFDMKGTEIWNKQIPSAISLPCVIDQDNSIYFVDNSKTLYAINEKHVLIWKFVCEKGLNCIPVFSKDNISVVTLSKHLYAIARKSGKILSRIEVKLSRACLSYNKENGDLYLGGIDGLVCIRKDKVAWEFKTGGTVTAPVSIFDDGTICFGGNDRKVHCLDKDGKKKWEYNLPDSIEDHIERPLIIDANGNVYGASCRGLLVSLTKDGKKRWSIDLDGEVQGGIVLANNGIIYVTVNNCIYAIGDKNN